jgi:hypothetical protein
MHNLALLKPCDESANRLFRRSNLQSDRAGAAGIALYDQPLVHG